jgi:hypothetical protein
MSVQFHGGPHHNRVTDYGDPLPRTLIGMDENMCYHEYLRDDDDTENPRRYRWIGPLGKPKWAANAAATAIG